MNKTAEIPESAKRIKIRPLALGEKTGHHHSLVCEETSIEEMVEMYEIADGTVFVRVKGEGVVLEHQEHKPSPVPPGDYEVRIQREVTDWGTTPVLD